MWFPLPPPPLLLFKRPLTLGEQDFGGTIHSNAQEMGNTKQRKQTHAGPTLLPTQAVERQSR